MPPLLVHRPRHTQSTPWQQMEIPKAKSPNLSTRYLLLMTCGMGGLQVIWSVVLANGTTHIISLGASKAWTPLIWLIAPLCGIFVQPLVGILSDRVETGFGRRRPLIALGSMGAVLSMNLFAWAADIAAVLSRPSQSETHDKQAAVSIVVATVGFLALQVSLQPVQMGFRALVVDKVDADQQIHANTWTSCWIGVGNIIGHLAGSLELDTFQSINRFQILTAIACVCLLSTTILCCAAVQETTCTLQSPRAGAPRARGTNLDSAQSSVSTHMDTTKYRMGSRLGSATYLVFSMAALLTNSLLPWLIGSRLVNARGLTATCRIPWAVCQALFALCMCLQVVVESWIVSATLIACTGISWAMVQGIPFAVIGEVLATDDTKGEHKAQMGAILGLHNVAISLPQILSAMVGSGLLFVAEAVESENGTAWILGMGSLPAMAATYFTAVDGFA
ncbi:hypothetical protein E4U43_003194 [Claviceps pusilla]|uniref:Sucrose transporter SUT1D n=1 Tax=Claviceps pusilla TaxID=123648 RepID=A0A9P7N536_9HYPO|nr:hypothetical protein E4U43_003194 [Claviceps pusilla]